MLRVSLSCVLAVLTTVVVSLTMLFVANAVSEVSFHERLYLSSTQAAFFVFPRAGLLVVLTLSPAVFFSYSLVFTAPVAIGLAVIRMASGRPSPLVARLVWLLSILWFDSWLAGFSIGHLASLGTGGWVLACALFPRRVVPPPPTFTVVAS